MAIKLCDLNPNIFLANADENQGSFERAHIVSCGRLLAVERAGRDANSLRLLENRGAEYTARLDETAYAVTNKNFQEKLHMFAAKRCAAINGEEPPADFAEIQQNQRKYLSDPNYLRVLSGILRDVVTPTGPAVMSNALDWLCQVVSVPVGQTYELDVMSNDIFLFEDDSFGASASKPRNHSYTKPIVLNPTLRTAAASVKWQQLVGNNADMGRLMNSISSGYFSKAVALWHKAMAVGAASTMFTPANLTFNTMSTPNWVKAVKRTAMVNGTSFKNIVAYGDLEACSKVLPTASSNAASVNLDAALSTMLGAEWARYGYLGEFMGARIMPMENVVVPGTQNTTISELLPPNEIYFAATGGAKPVYMGLEEGAPFTITMAPSQTADMTIDIDVGVCMDAKPVFASKVGVMKPV